MTEDRPCWFRDAFEKCRVIDCVDVPGGVVSPRAQVKFRVRDDSLILNVMGPQGMNVKIQIQSAGVSTVERRGGLTDTYPNYKPVGQAIAS